jgi:hypothetical protein
MRKRCGCGKSFKSGQALGGHRRGRFSCGILIEREARQKALRQKR